MASEQKGKQLVFNDYQQVVDYVFQALEAYKRNQLNPNPNPIKQKEITHYRAKEILSSLRESCMRRPNHQKSLTQSFSPPKATSPIAYKPIYERAQQILQTRRKKIVSGQIQTLQFQNIVNSKSRSHSRSNSKKLSKPNLSIKLENPQTEYKAKRKSQVIAKIIEQQSQTPKFTPKKRIGEVVRQSSKSNKRLRLDLGTSARMFPQYSQPRNSKMHIVRPEPGRNLSSKALSPIKKTPSKSPIRSPTKFQPTRLNRSPYIQNQKFQKTLSHSQLNQVISKIRNEIEKVS